MLQKTLKIGQNFLENFNETMDKDNVSQNKSLYCVCTLYCTFTVLYCAWTGCSCVVPILHRTVCLLYCTVHGLDVLVSCLYYIVLYVYCIVLCMA